MFNKDFYPTPAEVVDLMLKPLLKEIGGVNFFPFKKVLEPSAGKGDILDRILAIQQGKLRHNQFKAERDIFAVEIEPELQAILASKNYRVIGDDFLAFQTHLHFDLIIMNPPFSQGARHVLHAWEVSKGGEVVALLNAETINNPYSRERKQLATLIERKGSVEYIGKVFTDAERKTQVECAIVRLSKPAVYSKHDFLFEESEHESVEGVKYSEMRDVVQKNKYANYELAYNLAIQAKRELMIAESKLSHYCNAAMWGHNGRNDSRVKVIPDLSSNPSKHFQEWLEEFNAGAWRGLLRDVDFLNMVTSKVREQLEKRIDEQGLIAFTEENILKTLEALRQNASHLMAESIESIFDKLTAHYHENREQIEGWKTNQAWYVSDRFILPSVVSPNFSGKLEVQYGSHHFDTLNDIDRCLCFLSGKRMLEIEGTRTAINIAARDGRKVAESEFFEIKFFKKGTAHFKWKSEWLRSEFNYVAAMRRGFPLPERMSKKESNTNRDSSNETSEYPITPQMLLI